MKVFALIYFSYGVNVGWSGNVAIDIHKWLLVTIRGLSQMKDPGTLFHNLEPNATCIMTFEPRRLNVHQSPTHGDIRSHYFRTLKPSFASQVIWLTLDIVPNSLNINSRPTKG